MGKSLRSKPKLRAKSVKRKGEFAKFVDARNVRLAEKVKANLEKQKEDEMPSDDKEPVKEKKISTSGQRTSSRQRMKLKKNKKNGVTKF